MNATSRRLWFPRQHGAWAMLAVPLLLGVAASLPGTLPALQVLLAVVAVAGYLASATAQAWLRARRRPGFGPSLLAYGGTFAVLGLILLDLRPTIALTAIVVVPAATATLVGAKPGTRRDLANSLAQVAIALVLVPVAASNTADPDAGRVVRATLVAAGYLFGTVLVVRSVIRERGSVGFAAFSVGTHAALTVAAAVALPLAYAVIGAGLTARAAALPILQRRWAGSARPLRPVHVGIVEIVASSVLVIVAFAVGFGA